MDIEQKKIVLTGASGGIGLELTGQLIEKKAFVLGVTRNPNRLREFRESHGFNETQLRIIAADINSVEGRQRIADESQALSSGIDILINCAGTNRFASVVDLKDAQIRDLMNTNLLSPILLTKRLIPLLNTKSSTKIVNIGSALDSIGYPGFSVYCAAKFGLRGFSESLRRELSDTAISVCHVSPRTTKTSMNEEHVMQMNMRLGNKIDSAEYVVNKIIRAIESDKREMYIGWPETLFSRINRLFPIVVDKVIKKQLPTIRQYLS